MSLPDPPFLTFAELAHKWGYSPTYLHEIVSAGDIVPAILLDPHERFPGGEFRGGRAVGDVMGAEHFSYADYYVGTDTDSENHYENRPKCGRIVYCYKDSYDEDELGDGDQGTYSFPFFSESADPSATGKWFYFEDGKEIRGTPDGEQRFRFMFAEIERFERKNGSRTPAIDATPCQFDKVKVHSEPTIIHRLQNSRRRVLDAEIALAKKAATDPNSVHEVWAELVKLADAKKGCLWGIAEGEVKYSIDGTTPKFFSKKNLAAKFSRAKPR